MFRNYLKVAWVSLRKNKTFSIINIFGLGLGISLCLLILTIIKDQFGFDKFHPSADRVFRVNTEAIRKSGGTEEYASSPFVMGQYVKEHFPYVEKMVPLTRNLNGDMKANEKVLPVSGFMTSPDFFEVFGFTLKYGDPKSALTEPFSVILTEKTARKYFGDKDPLGKTVSFGPDNQYTITGVLNEPPGKTHLEFDVLGSVATLIQAHVTDNFGMQPDDWRNYYMSYIYVRLRNADYEKEMEKQLAVVAKEQYSRLDLESRDKGYRFYLQRLTDIVPGPMLSNSMGRGLPLPMLWFLSGLAIVVIVSAGFNYNSLSLAKSLNRSREIGIRKAAGAMRRQLITQFLVEAVLTSLLAFVLALFIYRLVLKPGFRELNIINSLDISLNDSGPLLAMFVLFSILTGFFSGLFPSLYLSKMNPVPALRGEPGSTAHPKLGFRRVLLVIQFVTAFIFVVTLVNMYRQTQYMLHADYGYRPDNIVNMDLRGNSYRLIREELKKYSAVEEIAGISHPMGTNRDRNIDVRIHPGDEPVGVRDYSIDDHYLDIVGLKTIAGKKFGHDLPVDHEVAAIVNEKFVERFKLGTASEAIGKTILVGDSLTLSIIGVLGNFHFKPFVYSIEPLLLRYNPGDLAVLNVKIKPTDKVNTIAQLERIWKSMDPTHDFSYGFYTDQMKDSYSDIGDIGKIVSVVAFMAVVVACLGLLGLVWFVVRRQVKEIGIRKILGASTRQIMLYLGRHFMKLILLAGLIGLPLGILLSQSLLGTFAFRINPVLGYVLGFFILVAIAILTIGSKVLFAALANPVKSLRTE